MIHFNTKATIRLFANPRLGADTLPIFCRYLAGTLPIPCRYLADTSIDMKELLIATTNIGKVREYRNLLASFPVRVLGLDDLKESYPVVEETETTFRGNAMLKAAYYHRKSDILTLADDSGLVIDALDGRPGVHSARYGGEGMKSEDQIQLVLEEMKNIPAAKRTARFICSIALCGKGVEAVFEESCEGWIGSQPIGNNGFGYDPIFIDIETGQTFGQLTSAEKASRSHRGKALEKATDYLRKLLSSPL
jgi:XTP/dITP diphosphohydrolase